MPSSGYSYGSTLVPQHVGTEYDMESTSQMAESIVSNDVSDDIVLKPQGLRGTLKKGQAKLVL